MHDINIHLFINQILTKPNTVHDSVWNFESYSCFFTFFSLEALYSNYVASLYISSCFLELQLSYSTWSRIGPRPRNTAATFLVTALVRRPVKPVVIRGVSTTNEEMDLSFLLIGSEMGDSTLTSSIFVFFDGKIFDLTSCLLWSALKSRYQKWVSKHKFRM
jgi:hypothetical protein